MLKLTVVDRKRYLNFVETHPHRNFLQYPSWADLKAEWRWSSELLGWFNKDAKMVGGALVLYRKVPGLNKFLAYIPRGPLIDWFTDIPLKEWFQPLFHHLKQRHVFSVKIDPPLVRKKWSAHTISNGLTEFQAHGLKNRSLTDLPPDEIMNDVEFVQQELRDMGWQQNLVEDSFDTVQPQFIMRLPLVDKPLDQIFSEFHSLWQKKINQAEWEGAEVEVGGIEDIPKFHQLLVTEAEQDQTQSRDQVYFQKLYKALSEEDPNRVRLYFAQQNDQLISTSLALRVNGHTWDLYSAKRNKSDHPANYLLRWRMIQDAYELGDHTFDFRGISTILNDDDPVFDSLRFKLGFHGESCELMGEWDYPVIPMLHWAFDMYMKKR